MHATGMLPSILPVNHVAHVVTQSHTSPVVFLTVAKSDRICASSMTFRGNFGVDTATFLGQAAVRCLGNGRSSGGLGLD